MTLKGLFLEHFKKLLTTVNNIKMIVFVDKLVLKFC